MFAMFWITSALSAPIRTVPAPTGPAPSEPWLVERLLATLQMAILAPTAAGLLDRYGAMMTAEEMAALITMGVLSFLVMVSVLIRTNRR